MNLFLCGFKASGKSFWGERLAKVSHLPFFDTDVLFEKWWGCSCKTFHRTKGEEEFREAESAVIQSLACDETIVALGGGSLLSEKNVSFLKSLGSIVYIKEEIELIIERLQSEEDPLFTKEALIDVYEKREKRFLEIADVSIWPGTLLELCSALQRGGSRTEKRSVSSLMDALRDSLLVKKT